MNLEQAIARLSKCQREELQDHAFGDAEVYWDENGEEVASGYFGRDCDVVSIGEHQFTGAEARRLRECGTRGRVERNDSTGPDEYREGECMPGLTKEGVLRELTGEADK